MAHMKKFNSLLLILLIFCPFVSFGQDDLLNFLEEKEEDVTNYTFATFKTTRLVSGHSVETNSKGVLQFMIGHRFSRLNEGWRDLWGIDNATIRFGFDYGLTDDINIAIGRSSYEKTFDGTLKFKFLKQKSGAKNFPFTATWVSTAYITAAEWANPERENYFTSRMNYHHALLMARKFNGFSLQIMPTMVHRNLVPTTEDKNSIFSLGGGGSIIITGSLRANVEYYYILPDQINSTIGGEEVQNSLSIGVDLETGGHVFQIHVTNSRGMTEKFLVGETTGKWLDGDIHFGFNISRVFTLRKPEELRK